jgi:hypothetical protein
VAGASTRTYDPLSRAPDWHLDGSATTTGTEVRSGVQNLADYNKAATTNITAKQDFIDALRLGVGPDGKPLGDTASLTTSLSSTSGRVVGGSLAAPYSFYLYGDANYGTSPSGGSAYSTANPPTGLPLPNQLADIRVTLYNGNNISQPFTAPHDVATGFKIFYPTYQVQLFEHTNWLGRNSILNFNTPDLGAQTPGATSTRPTATTRRTGPA